jgi:sulfur carrier protein
MMVEVNGAPLEMREGASVAEAVAASGAEPSARGLAVALDGDVIPRSEWERTTVRSGQRLEVVQAVQGG